MSPIRRLYVIILDEDIEGSPGQWRVVHEDLTLEDAKLHTQYENVIHEYPRDRYRARKLEQKTLIHIPSGDVKRGAIYELSEIAARMRTRRAAKIVKVKVKAPSISLLGLKKRTAASIKLAARKHKAKYAPIPIRKCKMKRAAKPYGPILTGKGRKTGGGGGK